MCELFLPNSTCVAINQKRKKAQNTHVLHLFLFSPYTLAPEKCLHETSSVFSVIPFSRNASSARDSIFFLDCSSHPFHPDPSRHHNRHLTKQGTQAKTSGEGGGDTQIKTLADRGSGRYRESGGDRDLTFGASRAQPSPQPLPSASGSALSSPPSRTGGAGASPSGPYHLPATGK